MDLTPPPVKVPLLPATITPGQAITPGHARPPGQAHPPDRTRPPGHALSKGQNHRAPSSTTTMAATPFQNLGEQGKPPIASHD